MHACTLDTLVSVSPMMLETQEYMYYTCTHAARAVASVNIFCSQVSVRRCRP